MGDPKKTTRLLLVDDEADFRRAAAPALERQGFEVEQADSGERALEMVGARLPDVVVLDLRMGGIDGITTLERMRAIAPALPVLILTGHGGLDDALAGIRLEVVDFVQKPVDMGNLAGRIRRLLADRHGAPMAEKTIPELMVGADCYQWFRIDQTVQEVVAALLDAVSGPERKGGKVCPGRRSVLVHDHDGRFVGLLRIEDIVRLMIPPYLHASSYASYFTGMFLAQTKLIGNQKAGELITSYFSIEEDAPLMEAVQVMVSERLANLPVVRRGELVGILRDEDLFRAIADSVLGR